MDENVFLLTLNAALFILATFLSYVLCGAFIKLSFRFDLLDYPEGRKMHLRPMPFLGGAGVFVSFWLLVVAAILLSGFVESVSWGKLRRLLESVQYLTPKLAGIFAGALVIWLVGLHDDKFRWTPFRKLAGQGVAAAILMSLGFTINLAAGLGPLGYAVTFLWILMIINAFNFIDSLDGHCAGIALISCVTFFTITQIIDQTLVSLCLMAFAGALLGFLFHNFTPARMFLGDNGSLFIGYMMAAFTLLCRYQVPEATYATLLIPVLVFGVPIYDTLSVVVVRLSRGVPPWQGDRNHFAHRLTKLGMTDRVAVIFSYFIAVTTGLVAVLTTQVDFFGAVLVGLIFLSIISVVAFLEYYAAESLRATGRLAELRKQREDKH
jgi:UDP-GlcNAc:undecaprenyl-phosphate/decaprenyl-phosphate GlcNAc-1-phosphate transferase